MTPFPINVGFAFLAAAASYYLLETPLRKKIRAHSNNSGAFTNAAKHLRRSQQN